MNQAPTEIDPRQSVFAETLGRTRGRARLEGRRIVVVGAGQRPSPPGESVPVGNGRAISALAAREGTAMTSGKAAYTRRVTVLWAEYFFVMVALSLALYAWAPWWVWSLFANLLTPVAAVTLFVGEYWLRYRLHPEFERASMLQALRAYRSTSMAGARRP